MAEVVHSSANHYSTTWGFEKVVFQMPLLLKAVNRYRQFKMTQSVQQHNLEKSIWTEADIETMGWHDACIHAFSFQWSPGKWTGDFVLDIDYIFEWVNPKDGKEHFSFWISPCTLVFKNAFDLNINIKTSDYAITSQEISDLILIDKEQNTEEAITHKWRIELTTGLIELGSKGFIQIVRKKPIYSDSQELTQEHRGGISFSRQPFV